MRRLSVLLLFSVSLATAQYYPPCSGGVQPNYGGYGYSPPCTQSVCSYSSKPAYGTSIASNSLTSSMRSAYLLNGSSLSTLINSVNGSEALTVNGTGMTQDTGSGAMAFTGSGNVTLPSAFITNLNAATAATVLIGFKSSATTNPVWAMGNTGAGTGDYIPFSDGNIYSSALTTTRFSFATPGGTTFSNFNNFAVTAQGNGSWLFYINGSLKSTNSMSGQSTVNVGFVPGLGKNNDSGFFTGSIEYFYVWTRVLTGTEISTLNSDPYTPVFCP